MKLDCLNIVRILYYFCSYMDIEMDEVAISSYFCRRTEKDFIWRQGKHDRIILSDSLLRHRRGQRNAFSSRTYELQLIANIIW